MARRTHKITTTKSITYDIELYEFTFTVGVQIRVEHDEGCWSSHDGSPGTPPSETREFTIESLVQIDENGKETLWHRPRRHPYYPEIEGEVQRLVSNEELEY